MGFDRFFLSVACINPGCFGACPGLIWCLICRKTACSSTIAGLLAAVWLWLLALSAGLALMGISCRGSCTAGHLPAFGVGLAALWPWI